MPCVAALEQSGSVDDAKDHAFARGLSAAEPAFRRVYLAFRRRRMDTGRTPVVGC